MYFIQMHRAKSENFHEFSDMDVIKEEVSASCETDPSCSLKKELESEQKNETLNTMSNLGRSESNSNEIPRGSADAKDELSYNFSEALTNSNKKNCRKRFACHECDYSSPRKYALKEHLMTHTGEKPFKCGDCDYSTRWKGYFTKHVIRHTEKASQKRLKLDSDIWKRISGEDGEHLATSRSFVCSHCNYYASTEAGIRKHFLTCVPHLISLRRT